jgi:hypothetical protein
MNADSVLGHALRASRLRVALRTASFAIPALIVPIALGWRVAPGWIPAVLVLGAFATLCAGWIAMRPLDARWLAQRLDECDPRMEDSARLLFMPAARATTLQRLQQRRLQQRLEAAPPPDLRPEWPARALSLSWLIAIAISLAVVLWPHRGASTHPAPQPVAARSGTAPTDTRITQRFLDITPPAYTGLPKRSEDRFEVRVPERASVQWRLRFVPAPTSASLAFHDGQSVPLQREGEDWIASRRIGAPLLYRIVLNGALPLRPDRLYRIDVTPDQAPQIKAITPEETLTLRRAGQRSWTVSFEAQDDYGLAASAPLRMTLAQGEGENIQFSERSLALQGRGGPTRKRYAHTFDLASLGLTAGSDFVVQLSVSDNRVAGPQTTRGPSYILRWPPEAATETSGLDGLVKKALPAYFRSQRQIIIDSEALLAQRRKLPADTYMQRSDAIGVDQRLLRLRYGQFLGEESEGAPRARLPTTDVDSEHETPPPPRKLLPTADAEDEAEADAREQAAKQEEAPSPTSQDTHDHADEPASGFGRSVDVLAEYGHTHDDSEAATLLDPETRRTLKSALDQMWQAELNLRQGHPDLALPYEYKALDYIKQVQQAGRIYLARVGSELPPIDESRRLSGERNNLAPRDDLLVAATPASPLLPELWRALESPAGANSPPLDLDSVEHWLRANERRVPDALGVIAAIDSVRNEPACMPCRQLLRSRLWPLLPRAPAKPARRAQPDRSGQAYLDALQAERP